jgi:hypothetical protein
MSNPDSDFETLEPTLRSRWQSQNRTSVLDWDTARPATLDAYTRLREKYKK